MLLFLFISVTNMPQLYRNAGSDLHKRYLCNKSDAVFQFKNLETCVSAVVENYLHSLPKQ